MRHEKIGIDVICGGSDDVVVCCGAGEKADCELYA